MSIMDKLEIEARKFMQKSLKIEDDVQNDILKILNRTRDNIELVLKANSDVNIRNLESIINTSIRPIIDQQKIEMNLVIDNAINNQYEVGITNAGRLLEIADNRLEPVNNEDVRNEEVLLALLLFGKRIIDSFNDNLVDDIHKDLTSIYVESKNVNNRQFNNQNRNTDEDSTVNTILTGAFIAKYIFPTFKKYRTRAETISRTEVIRALNHGHMARYINTHYSGLRVKWVYIRARNTCSTCIERGNGGENGDGVYPIEMISPPPLHPNCRCILIPWNYRWL